MSSPPLAADRPMMSWGKLKQSLCTSAFSVKVSLLHIDGEKWLTLHAWGLFSKIEVVRWVFIVPPGEFIIYTIYTDEKQTLSGGSTHITGKQIAYDKHSVRLWHSIIQSHEKIPGMPVKSSQLRAGGSFSEPCEAGCCCPKWDAVLGAVGRALILSSLVNSRFDAHLRCLAQRFSLSLACYSLLLPGPLHTFHCYFIAFLCSNTSGPVLNYSLCSLINAPSAFQWGFQFMSVIKFKVLESNLLKISVFFYL